MYKLFVVHTVILKCAGNFQYFYIFYLKYFKCRLQLHNNLLEELPPEIGSLRKLKIINLSDNKLQNLPRQFYMLEELCKLHLKNNHISTLEAEIGNLVMLTHMVKNTHYYELYMIIKANFLNRIITCLFRIYHTIV